MAFPYISFLAVLSGAAFVIYSIYKSQNQNYEHTYGEQGERRGDVRVERPRENRRAQRDVTVERPYENRRAQRGDVTVERSHENRRAQRGDVRVERQHENRRAQRREETDERNERPWRYDRTCTICLDVVPENDGLCLDTCGHVFHTPCFKSYLANRPTMIPVCPNCRCPMACTSQRHTM